jgi:hypothetical protein
MNNELEWIWNETVVTKFKVLSRDLSEGTEKNHKPRSGKQVSGSRLEPGTSRIRSSRSANKSAATFGEFQASIEGTY